MIIHAKGDGALSQKGYCVTTDHAPSRMGLGCSCLKPALPVVPTVDVSRMLGEWRVIAVLPTPLEKGAFNPTEMYTWDKSKQRIDVGFTFNKGSLDGVRLLGGGIFKIKIDGFSSPRSGSLMHDG